MAQLKSIVSALPPKYRLKITLIVRGTDTAEYLYYRSARDIPEPYLSYDCGTVTLKTRHYHIAPHRPDSNPSGLTLLDVLLTCSDYANACKLTIAKFTAGGVESRCTYDWETALRKHSSDNVCLFDETAITLEGGETS